MKKSGSSRRWLDEHVNDVYVKQAQREGYRSRAVYKLLEINQKDRILRQGMTVVDLGAAPGGWSQIAYKHVGKKGSVIASDILAMEPIEGVTFVQGDFREEEVLNQLLEKLGGRSADLVISDMAPNITGMSAVDQPQSMYLVELALEMARTVLVKDGDLLMKVFQGSGFDEFQKELRSSFKKIVIRKPAASRPRSKEVYILARNYILE